MLTPCLKFETLSCVREVRFIGSSLDDLRALPKAVRQDMGRQIDRVQRGLDPKDWKAMPSVGRGVREIRIRDEGNAYRTLYVANIDDAIHVLHVFTKKSRRTRQGDIDTARARLRALQLQRRRRG